MSGPEVREYPRPSTSAGAGDGRGFYCLPEVNDEVLIAFEHGDVHRPYIVGALWSMVLVMLGGSMLMIRRYRLDVREALALRPVQPVVALAVLATLAVAAYFNFFAFHPGQRFVHLYDPATDHIITAASCTTNCLAPVVKVMHEQVGIVHGCMTTIHDITNTQTIVDKGHKDLRRARACGESLIPTSTGSAKAITKIFPELTGKLNGHAVRVPLLNASLTDFVFEAARPVTAEEVNSYFKEAAEGELKGILGYEERPLVSADYKDDPRSAIVDAPSTLVIDGTQVKVYAWYDNEWGYVNRMMELTAHVAKSI